MPATTTTTELFPKATVTLAQVQNELRLRIKASAIRSVLDENDPTNYILITDWNVLGENDDTPTSLVAVPVAHPAPPVPPAPTSAPPTAPFAPSNVYIAANPGHLLGQAVGTGQCVAFVQAVSGAPHTSQWRRGARAKGNASLASGTAIATFDANGTYGNHTNGTSHAAIYLAQDSTGLGVYDQWLGQPVHHRVIRFGGTPEVNDGNEFFVIA